MPGGWTEAYYAANSALSVGVFIVLQILVFRRIDQRACVKWLNRLMTGVAGVAAAGALSPLVPGHPLHGVSLGTMLVAGASSVGLYGLGVYLYCLYGFGVAESSIRVRILEELGRGDAHGVTFAQLLERYNEEDVIRKRLARFIQSGDLMLDGTIYRPGRRFSVFTVQNRLITWMREVFARPYERSEQGEDMHVAR